MSRRRRPLDLQVIDCLIVGVGVLCAVLVGVAVWAAWGAGS